jgi:predicted small metal-binding protein
MLFPSNTLIALKFNENMVRLSCKESGLECNYTAEGRTEKDVLNQISEHAVKVHNLKPEDIYDGHMPTAFLCHARGKFTTTS